MLRSGEEDGEEDDEVFALLPRDDVFKFKDVELSHSKSAVVLCTTSDAEMMSENPSRRSNVRKRMFFKSISCRRRRIVSRTRSSGI